LTGATKRDAIARFGPDVPGWVNDQRSHDALSGASEQRFRVRRHSPAKREKRALLAPGLDGGAGRLVHALRRVAMVLAKTAAASRQLRLRTGKHGRPDQREAEQDEQQPGQEPLHSPIILLG
jgi:hypothetical protein